MICFRIKQCDPSLGLFHIEPTLSNITLVFQEKTSFSLIIVSISQFFLTLVKIATIILLHLSFVKSASISLHKTDTFTFSSYSLALPNFPLHSSNIYVGLFSSSHLFHRPFHATSPWQATQQPSSRQLVKHTLAACHVITVGGNSHVHPRKSYNSSLHGNLFQALVWGYGLVFDSQGTGGLDSSP